MFYPFLPALLMAFLHVLLNLEKTDLPSIARGHLEILKASIKKAIPLETDKMSKYHLKDVLQRIDLALDPK